MTSGTAGWRAEEVFDRSLYDRLDEETGGAGPEIAATLLSVTEVRKRAMLDSAKAGNITELSRVAHTAKSGARSVGLMRLAALCDMIEHLPPGSADLAALCSDIEREFAAADAALQGLQQG